MKIRALVIEDERIFRRQLATYLRARGLLVDEAEDGQQGLELALSRFYDLVFCDLYMPRVDGYQVLQRLAQERPSLPIVVCSAKSHMDDISRALSAGAVDYVIKPIGDWQLLNQLIAEQVPAAAGIAAITPAEELSPTALTEDLLPSQRQHLPPFTVTSHYDGWYLAAGIEHLDSDSLLIYLVDVSISADNAANSLTAIKGLISHIVAEYHQGLSADAVEPAMFLQRLNRELRLSAQLLGLPAAAVVVSARQQQVRFANAGLDAMQVGNFTPKRGLALGQAERPQYHEAASYLTAAQTLVINATGALSLLTITVDIALASVQAL